ncbi:hypothetical protein KVR01_007093 [Diaporthe batatas]|uniref:uncharacterized protein n=1 Tax=Diaporthe batatas TaxID=748121 RepID=UPI001D05705E|nr:uncharacterized protein KVR01_007093 [Diaporthe batatas]KAG8163796.1 hypothetical protein KVR01_007093 [Diaporthe batatas]
MTSLERLSDQAREDNRKVLFAEIINSVALEGGAAQANAAFAGALLGAYLGYDAIPEKARRGLSRRRFLMRKSQIFCEVFGVISGDLDMVEEDSEIGAEPDERHRTAIQRAIQRDHDFRLAMLIKRWERRRDNMPASA